jgi:hypothetical protein
MLLELGRTEWNHGEFAAFCILVLILSWPVTILLIGGAEINEQQIRQRMGH